MNLSFLLDGVNSLSDKYTFTGHSLGGGGVHAFYVDADILSLFQVSANTVMGIPSAIGQRILMDGPFDSALLIQGAVTAISTITTGPWTGVANSINGIITLVKAHLSGAFLYGVLTKECTVGTVPSCLNK